MSSSKRLGVALLLLGALCVGATAGADAAPRVTGMRTPAVVRATAVVRTTVEAQTPSLLGAPVVPLSVTVGRTFTVTGSVPPGFSDETTLACYRRVSGGWTLERSVAASVTTPPSGAQFSAKLSLVPAGTWVVRAEAAGSGEASGSVSPTSTPIRVSASIDAIVWNRDGVLTLPETMDYRRDARQLIVTTAASLRSRTGTVTVYEYRSGDWVQLLASPCRLGRNGLMDGRYRHRGNGTTPTGIWVMPGYVFGQRARTPTGTRLPYRHITKYHWWSSEKGRHYNSWVRSRRHVDGEHLIDYPIHYEYAVSTGYNAKPNSSVFGRGAGIFLHVWKGPTTSGCVSVPRVTMQKVFRILDPNKRRVFVVGTVKPGAPTSVLSY